jgi:hypothetical protein
LPPSRRGPAPPPGHGISPKLIAALGAGATIVVVAALVVFLLGRGGGGTSHPAAVTTPKATTTTPSTTTTTSTTISGTGCSSSNLQKCLPSMVENGTYTLDTGSVQNDPAFISSGATAGLSGKYFDNNNNQVDVFLAAEPDSNALTNQIKTTSSNLQNAGCSQLGMTPVSDAAGTQYQISFWDCSSNTQNLSPAWAIFAGTSGLFGSLGGPFAPLDAEGFASSMIQGGP